MWTLVRTDFKARYHGTLSGFAWAMLKPLAMFVVLMTVFSFVFQDPRYKLNLIVGLFLWDFFTEGTRRGTGLVASAQLSADEGAMSVVDPRRHVDLECTAHAGRLLARDCPVSRRGRTGARRRRRGAVPRLRRGARPDGRRVLARVERALRALRDLNQVWDVAAQAGFFLAPIVYPLGIIPERFHFYFYLWPPTPVIEFSRAVLVNGIIPR